uniref:Uncharacterized protein n=1 Tax=Hyaloperonospora arabidopsidis (strain Emoy2) TaxID=559515 RepID=M4BMR8_HYAAE
MVSLGATVALGNSYGGKVVTRRRGSRLLSMDARFLAAAPHQHSNELQTSGQWVLLHFELEPNASDDPRGLSANGVAGSSFWRPARRKRDDEMRSVAGWSSSSVTVG